jgi:hypothetical protein
MALFAAGLASRKLVQRMTPRYQFMTGASFYQLEAASAEEALSIILGELKPRPDAEAVIRSTLREVTPGAVPSVPQDLGPESDSDPEPEAEADEES